MRRALVVASVLAACASAPKPEVDEGKATSDDGLERNSSVGPIRGGRRESGQGPEAEVRATVEKLYRALEALEPEQLETLLTPEAVGLGLGPGDFFTSRPALIEEVRQQLVAVGLRGDTLTVKHSQLEVGVAKNGRSAWFHDWPVVERSRGGKTVKYRPRVTGHVVAEGVGYQIDALQVSLPVPNGVLFAKDADAKLGRPRDPPALKGEGSAPLLELTQKLLDDLKVKVDRTADGAEVVLVGTDASEVFIGGAQFKKLARPLVGQAKKSGFSYRFESGLRSKLAGGGASGWVLGNVVLTVGQGRAGRELVPFRSLWVFAKGEKGFQLVSEHQSVGLKPELREPATAPELAALPSKAEKKAIEPAADAGVRVTPFGD